MPDRKETTSDFEEREAVRRRLRKKRRKEVLYLRLTVLAFLAILLLLMGVEKFMNIKQHRAEEEFWEETKDAAVNTENVAEADEGGLFSAGLKIDEGTGKEDTATAGGSGDEGITHIRSCSEKWNLILVNPWNAIPEDYQVELEELSNGQAVDARCYPMLQQMMDDCRGEGLNPVICSSWRSRERQEALIADMEYRLIRAGYPEEDVAVEAAKTVAVPGTSEHELGLALDIVDSSYPELETEQENTPVQKWLMKNSWKYGFVLRYPSDKSALTGIIYEPWHYRYVGKEAAKIMYGEDLCLEEYLEKYCS